MNFKLIYKKKLSNSKSFLAIQFQEQIQSADCLTNSKQYLLYIQFHEIVIQWKNGFWTSIPQSPSFSFSQTTSSSSFLFWISPFFFLWISPFSLLWSSPFFLPLNFPFFLPLNFLFFLLWIFLFSSERSRFSSVRFLPNRPLLRKL